MFFKFFKILLAVTILLMAFQQSAFCIEPEGHHDDAAHCDTMHHHCSPTCHTNISADTLARSSDFKPILIYSIESVFEFSYTNPTIHRLKRPPIA